MKVQIKYMVDEVYDVFGAREVKSAISEYDERWIDYRTEFLIYMGREWIWVDAKKYEPYEEKPIMVNIKNYGKAYCPLCEADIHGIGKVNYCPNCGQPVKWHDDTNTKIEEYGLNEDEIIKLINIMDEADSIKRLKDKIISGGDKHG